MRVRRSATIADSRVGIPVIFIWCALAVGCRPADSQLFFSGVPYPEDVPMATDGARLELVREYGNREEGLAFGHIADLAVSGSTLAVLDPTECKVLDGEHIRWERNGRWSLW